MLVSGHIDMQVKKKNMYIFVFKYLIYFQNFNLIFLFDLSLYNMDSDALIHS